MRPSWTTFLAAMTLATWTSAKAQDHSSTQTVLQARTGVWTYPGTGTVNTYWIETSGGGTCRALTKPSATDQQVSIGSFH